MPATVATSIVRQDSFSEVYEMGKKLARLEHFGIWAMNQQVLQFFWMHHIFTKNLCMKGYAKAVQITADVYWQIMDEGMLHHTEQHAALKKQMQCATSLIVSLIHSFGIHYFWGCMNAEKFPMPLLYSGSIAAKLLVIFVYSYANCKTLTHQETRTQTSG